MSRIKYTIEHIVVNDLLIDAVVIDGHYREKHGSYLNDQKILEIVRRLDGRKQLPDSKVNGFSYFASVLEYQGKRYRLVWLLEEQTIYIGVINVYRDDRER
jgi:hypothetical protein